MSVAFACLTLDLPQRAMANVDVLRRHGAMAVMEGRLLQLSLIGLTGFGALLARPALRGIEGELLRRWTGHP